jgi:hypothetical protein
MGRGRDSGGRGTALASWRFNALPYKPDDGIEEEELQDTGTSPVKGKDMEIDHDDANGETGAKRRLQMDVNPDIGNSENNNEEENMQDMGSDGLPSQLEEGNLAKLSDRSKRTKKAGADSPSLGSAGSQEEPVRAQ